MIYSNENENEAQHEPLKLDSRGHVLISLERRAALLEEFDRSGMTGAGFARHYGIKYTTFAHWIRMRKRANLTPKPGPDKKFLLVTGETPSPNPGAIANQTPKGLVVQSSLSKRQSAKALSDHIRLGDSGKTLE